MDERLSKRKQMILKAIVDAHISHGEPVASKALAQDIAIACSSATIRNEMAELEEMGYLTQPYTSAGRIPSELGYRFYVDSLVNQYSETKSEIDEINERLRFKLTEMDAILEEASRLAASFTDYTGIAFKAGSGKARITSFNSVTLSPHDFMLVMRFPHDVVKAKQIHLPFTVTESDVNRFVEAANLFLVNLDCDSISMPIIARLEAIMGPSGAMVHPVLKVIYETMSEQDTTDVRVEGMTKLLQYPEYADVHKLQGLLGVLEEKEKLIDVIESHTVTPDGLNIYIGRDEDGDAMAGSTLIFRNVNVGGSTVAVGVIGPKRMNYSKVIGMINGLASGIDRMFSEDISLPEGKQDSEKGKGHS